MNLGYTTDQDLNCENKNGVMISPSTTKNGRSVTVANTILKAQYNNSNFYITRNCQVNFQTLSYDFFYFLIYRGCLIY